MKKVVPLVLAILFGLMAFIPTSAYASSHNKAQRALNHSLRVEKRREKKAQRAANKSAKRWRRQHHVSH